MTKTRSESMGSGELFRARTHPKILFKPLVATLVSIAFYIFLKEVLFMFKSEGDVKLWLQITSVAIPASFALVYSIKPTLHWATDTFIVTETQVKTEAGIISRKSQEISHGRISQVEVERGLLDRIFGSGTIKLYDASNTLGLEFKDVPRVKEVKTIIDKKRGV